jgi:hypothetical protein
MNYDLDCPCFKVGNQTINQPDERISAALCTSDAATGSSSSNSVNTAAIAGGVVGGVAGAAIIVAGGVFFVRRRREREYLTRVHSNAKPTAQQVEGGAVHL